MTPRWAWRILRDHADNLGRRGAYVHPPCVREEAVDCLLAQIRDREARKAQRREKDRRIRERHRARSGRAA